MPHALTVIGRPQLLAASSVQPALDASASAIEYVRVNRGRVQVPCPSNAWTVRMSRPAHAPRLNSLDGLLGDFEFFVGGNDKNFDSATVGMYLEYLVRSL